MLGMAKTHSWFLPLNPFLTQQLLPQQMAPPNCQNQNKVKEELSLTVVSLPVLLESCQVCLPESDLNHLGRATITSHLDLGHSLPSGLPASTLTPIILFCTQPPRDPFWCKFYPGFPGQTLLWPPVTQYNSGSHCGLSASSLSGPWLPPPSYLKNCFPPYSPLSSHTGFLDALWPP